MKGQGLPIMATNKITSFYRFLFLLVFSVALMIVDHRSQLLDPARSAGSVINLPFQMLLNLPSAASQYIEAHYPDDSLHQKYAELAEKALAQEARLQRYDALKAENRRLSALLSRSGNAGDQMLLAEIVEIGLEPFTHRIALNRGAEAGIYLGQPAITPDGVLGQVSDLGINRSVVTLITDPSHAIPVQIQRNGLRTIVQGLGAANRVSVPFLSGQADIRNADILVTSGLGGGFPAGYKVAQVQEVVTDANAPFLSVSATTFANIEFAKEVLLLWNDRPNPNPAASGKECE